MDAITRPIDGPYALRYREEDCRSHRDRAVARETVANPIKKHVEGSGTAVLKTKTPALPSVKLSVTASSPASLKLE